ncbi:MAG TPA: cupin domain-containing protein [Spirochaetota bacterium]|nr:cupin domain-containing protein [Spirochaetota bacterium]HOM11311.1 cupin domain-containing protein [Spirochaetota bacterium]HPP51116.1 cupin domain-containing protein [Spirochaetota bacterium]
MSNLFNDPQNFVNAIEYQSNAIVSKTIIQNKSGSLTLFAFGQGQSLSEHTAPYDAFVMVLDGQFIITIGGKENTVKAGEAIIMPANVPHALAAANNAKMLLVMIRG